MNVDTYSYRTINKISKNCYEIMAIISIILLVKSKTWKMERALSALKNRSKVYRLYYSNNYERYFIDFAMDIKQVRVIFLYEYKLGHKAAAATRNINSAFGEYTINERTVQHWFKKIRSGDENLEDEDDRGRPSLVDNDQLKALVEADPRTTIRQLAQELGLITVFKVIYGWRSISRDPKGIARNVSTKCHTSIALVILFTTHPLPLQQTPESKIPLRLLVPVMHKRMKIKQS
ncbi:Histone-lysine N-methyltransferase SETMAR [Anthophora retusa]